MSKVNIVRDSAEYAEILSEVFAETVRGSEDDIMNCEDECEGVTPSLMQCLQYVYLHGSCSVRAIAGGLEVTVSAASQLVDRLVRKELVTRRENESDRRYLLVELTNQGRDLARNMRSRRSRWFEDVFSKMNPDMLASFVDSIEGFLKIALADDPDVEHACSKCGRDHVNFCVVNEVKERMSQSDKTNREK